MVESRTLPIRRLHQVGQKQLAQIGVLEVVAQKDLLRLFGVEKLLKLRTDGSNPRGEDRILAVVFCGNQVRRSPAAPEHEWIGIGR